jgi:hypothetical protein
VPSTRNVIDEVDGLLDPLELPGAVGLLPLPPPHPIVAAARPSAHTHRMTVTKVRGGLHEAKKVKTASKKTASGSVSRKAVRDLELP